MEEKKKLKSVNRKCDSETLTFDIYLTWTAVAQDTDSMMSQITIYYHAMQCNAMQYKDTKFNAMEYNAIQCYTKKYNAI